ncbi:translation initiation factor IF-2 [Acetivibrio ethanolgignens]|uniref:Translation initiation factor IF-2 n=1 Tax=Acetivibrio ethanolgignens TaxID=290052 RepID=A0A0V8QAN6_9FIRM|nr:translation initiation factor IF-2 [Acetivibrio ethanolgignens]KSV57647.1 translation initiation factor IF-2 [Acetivibrio ethanolgignens]
MAKMKIYEIAKSLNIKSGDLVKALNDNGFEVKSHNSNIEDEAIAFILKQFAPKKEETKKPEPKEEVKPEVKQPEKKPEVKAAEVKVEEKKSKEKKTEEKMAEVKKTEEKPAGNRGNDRRNNDGRNNDRRNNNRGNDNRGNGDNRGERRDFRNNDRNGQFNRNNDNRGERKDFRNNERNSQFNRGNDNRNDNRGNGDRGDRRDFRNNDSRNQGRGQNGGFGGNDRRGGQGRGKDSFEKALSSLDNSAVMEKNSQRRNDFNGKGKNNKNRNTRDYDMEEKPLKKDPNRKGAFIMPKVVKPVEEPEDTIKTIILPETLTIRELADKMKLQASAVVKKLLLQGKMFSINQEISYEEAEEIALEFNCIAEPEEKVDIIEELTKEVEDAEDTLVKRPPVVCVMGHVDHGKTSLLDAIRETHVTDREAGGITQHIGAYTVKINDETITFLDTPGHEAFTSMRMRGAKSTDIAILVVAADDGVMPQTVEAINHAKAAEVEIIVAINKIDKPGANIERVKQELSEYELIPEDWGGSTVFVPVSAKTREGLEQLLEMILLTAEVAELKANPDRLARGIVIEAQLDKGRGPVATILVQKGTLHVGDALVIGSAYGKVRAMIDDKGRRVKEAGPSTPVEVLGLNEVPDAGELVMATENEKEARNIAEAYIKQSRESLLADTKSRLSLDGLFSQIQAGNIKELNLIIKADVQGSVEAVKQSLLKLSNDEVAIRVIHGGVGAVNESDVMLATASNAIIIGFNVRPDPTAKATAEREKVDLRLYKVIYNAIEDIESAMKGMLDPIFEEKVIGHAEIRQIFKASGLGSIAGSYVLDGKIVRGSMARIFRGEEKIYEGELASLKRFKDDVKEVNAGYECGLVFEKFNDIKEEDRVEIYVMEEVPR